MNNLEPHKLRFNALEKTALIAGGIVFCCLVAFAIIYRHSETSYTTPGAPVQAR